MIEQTYLFRPSREAARHLSLSKGSINDERAKGYSLVDNTLTLVGDEGKFVARLKWDGEKFSGMDTGGYCELVPNDPDSISKKFEVKREIKLHGAVTDEPRKDRIDLRYNLQAEVGPSSIESETAVAIICCDRFNYFKEMLEALAPQIKNYPVFLFADFPDNEDNVVQAKHVEFTKALVPQATIVKRSQNFGCGLNIFDARDQLFINYGYEKVFVFEDDMVPSSNYVEYCERLWAWSRQFSNVGAVQGWSRCFLEKTKKNRLNKEVHVTFDNAWGYLMSKECWEATRPEFIEYTGFLTDKLYRNRDNFKISRWQTRFKQKDFIPKGSNPVLLDNKARDDERETLDNLPTGQDGTTYLMMRDAGYVRLASTVNRGKYIGRTGIHSTPEIYDRSRLGMIKLDEIKIPDTFKLRGSK